MHRNMMVIQVSDNEEDIETENVASEYIIEADDLEDTVNDVLETADNDGD